MELFNLEEYLSSLPDDIEEIHISGQDFICIPSLERFKNLKYLDCTGNYLRNLPVLPETLIELQCKFNKIVSLPILPKALKILDCSINRLTNLPELPKTIEELNCRGNLLTNLPQLPKTIEELNCSYNILINLPEIPNRMKKLNCSCNRLTNLPELPNTLENLFCSNNNLPFEDIDSWRTFNKFKSTYYKLKYGNKLEKYYIKNVRNRYINKEVIDVVYSPDYNFYKRLLDPNIIKMFS